MLTLYCAPNTISVAVAIALHEAGLEFEPRRVDFASAEQTKAPYQAINPKGRVPALATDRGILTETGAILDYIATLAPQAGLLPPDPFAAARMREAMYYIASTLHVNHAHKMRGARWADQQSSFDDMRAKVPQTMAAGCAHLEAAYAFDPYLLGARLTLAECYLYVPVTWLANDGVDVVAFPGLARFAAAMAARPSVLAARAGGLL